MLAASEAGGGGGDGGGSDGGDGGGGGGRRARQVATTDVCVPLSELPALMARMEAHVAAGCLRGHVYAVAHAGDGNAHHFLAHDPADPLEAAEAARLGRALVADALALGGTCTGEHGVGVGKRAYLPLEFGQPAVDVMHALKRALDPRGVLNPGKKLPPREEEGEGGGEGGGAPWLARGPPCS